MGLGLRVLGFRGLGFRVEGLGELSTFKGLQGYVGFRGQRVPQPHMRPITLLIIPLNGPVRFRLSQFQWVGPFAQL